ncbi:thioredoxin-dependent thiol peroxidase [Desulfitobacterium metallireducens]|uniref:thioredoxin-dependent peroxiredoxin n=1 Tax=Desulfitobacterium metallireducens DSM 15288 TaxID=871968 RepID=W0E674_9FIRM|nr:thioredoxin-dependent thiol peroxidase [Desulfitobacterium metallireducens]AHF06237.1 peroxiredoxin [Desulfitobacterium metallireducens DSM 15288]
MIAVGEVAPDFTAQGSQGEQITLSTLRGKKVILYFYPKDMTSGCTTEACDFRDHHAEFLIADTVIIGISKDSMGSHHKFIEKYQLPFVLVSDPELAIIQAYGVWKEKNMYGKKTMGIERTTIVIDEQGFIRKIYSKVKVKGHVEQVLQDLK